MRTPDAIRLPARVIRLTAAAVLAVPFIGTATAAAAPSQTTPPVSQPDLAPAAAGYDIGLSNTILSYNPGDLQATFRVTVCNQGTDPSGAVGFQFFVPTGAGYVTPTSSNPDGRLLDVTLTSPSLAAGASEQVDITVGWAVSQTSPIVTAAQVTTTAGTDVDSSNGTPPIAAGVVGEGDLTNANDACTVESAGADDDNRDIAVLNLQAAPTTTTSTTAPTPSSLNTTVTTAVPGPGVSPNTLPITGTPRNDARSPLLAVALALPLGWLGVVLSIRGRRLQGAARR